MKTFLITLIISIITGCGDYNNQTTLKVQLTDIQKKSVFSIYTLNTACAAISRYSNDIGSPIDDTSYINNAKTSELLLRNNFTKDGKKLSDEDLDKFFAAFKKRTYEAVIDDLNQSDNIEYIYEALGSINDGLNGAKINNCSDVSAVTRRVLDPILVF
jgi:hypothetical protein